MHYLLFIYTYSTIPLTATLYLPIVAKTWNSIRQSLLKKKVMSNNFLSYSMNNNKFLVVRVFVIQHWCWHMRDKRAAGAALCRVLSVLRYCAAKVFARWKFCTLYLSLSWIKTYIINCRQLTTFHLQLASSVASSHSNCSCNTSFQTRKISMLSMRKLKTFKLRWNISKQIPLTNAELTYLRSIIILEPAILIKNVGKFTSV